MSRVKPTLSLAREIDREESSSGLVVVGHGNLGVTVQFAISDSGRLKTFLDLPARGNGCLGADTRRQCGGRVVEDPHEARRLLFNSERLDRIGDLLGEKGLNEWHEFTEELAKYDLKISDLGLLLQGEAGFAVALEAREGKLPRPLGIGWLEPGGDLTARLLAALDKVLVDHPSEDIRRTDIELAGHKVIHLSQTIARSRSAVGIDELRRLSPDERKALREGRAEAETVVVGQDHFLLSRQGDRLLMVMDFGPLEDEMQERLKGEAPPDDASNPAIEALKGLVARFIAAHTDTEAGPTLSIAQTPGLSAALPTGVPLIEVLADLRPLVKLAETATDPKLHRIIKGLGAEQLGAVAYRATLDENLLRSGFFLSSAEPRSGVMTLVDQPPLASQPPAWVPAEIVSYAHMRLDLAQAFEQIKKPLLEEMGDQVRPILNLVENQLKSAVQADLATLFASLGSQHIMLAYPPHEIDDNDPDKAAAASDRSAFVWQIKDEALWKRVFDAVAAASGKEVVEEQGFKGVRFDEPNEGGAFVGHGYLVVGLGAGLTESVLSTLRNPPAGQASLTGSALLARANELLPPVEGLAYHLTDMNRYVKTTRRMFSSLLNMTLKTHEEGDADDADLASTVKTLQKLLPSEDELEGVFGVEVGQVVASPQGLSSRSVIELPAAGR